MAVQKYKFALNQRSLSEDRRRSGSPRESDIRLNAGDSSFATASIRAIKKDVVKEKRKQFEEESSPKGGAANGAASTPRKMNIQKSKSYLFLSQDQDPGKQCSFQDTDLRPTSVAAIPSLQSGRNCQSVMVEQRVKMFDNTGKSNESVNCVAPKPSIQPKPERLSVKRPSIKSDDGKSVSSGATGPSFGPLAPLTEFPSPNAKDQNFDTNKVYLSGSPVGKAFALKSSPKVEYSPKADFTRPSPSNLKSFKKKELNVGKCFDSPDVGRILADDASNEGKSADEGKAPVFKIKCNDDKNYKLPEKMSENSTTMGNSSNVNLPIKVADCLNKSPVKPEGISPPPKPPRILSELNQSPLAKPCNEQSTYEVKPSPQMKQMVKGGTYEHLTDAISVVKVSEGLAISNQASPKSPLFPSIDKNTPAKTELSNAGKKFPVDRSKIDQWWENKFIRAPPTAAPRKKENFKTKRINNPTYMYAKVGQPDDIISGRGLVRHHSDELLDASPLQSKRMGSLKLRFNDGPIYHDPIDVVPERQKLIGDVAFDKDGYAVPAIRQGTGLKVRIFFFSLLY